MDEICVKVFYRSRGLAANKDIAHCHDPSRIRGCSQLTTTQPRPPFGNRSTPVAFSAARIGVATERRAISASSTSGIGAGFTCASPQWYASRRSDRLPANHAPPRCSCG